jgi:hypothetical protein
VSVGGVIAIVIVFVILAVAAALASRLVAQRAALRSRLGPEYDRLVRQVGRRGANAEFDERRRRVAALGIKPLSPQRQAGYGDRWLAAQERFIDGPADSVRSAAALVTAVAAERGYEVDDTGQLLRDLSVDYGRQLAGYRQALAVTEKADEASTEDLRLAVLGHRGLFRELAGVTGDDQATPTAVTTVTARKDGTTAKALPAA